MFKKLCNQDVQWPLEFPNRISQHFNTFFLRLHHKTLRSFKAMVYISFRLSVQFTIKKTNKNKNINNCTFKGRCLCLKVTVSRWNCTTSHLSKAYQLRGLDYTGDPHNLNIDLRCLENGLELVNPSLNSYNIPHIHTALHLWTQVDHWPNLHLYLGGKTDAQSPSPSKVYYIKGNALSTHVLFLQTVFHQRSTFPYIIHTIHLNTLCEPSCALCFTAFSCRLWLNCDTEQLNSASDCTHTCTLFWKDEKIQNKTKN